LKIAILSYYNFFSGPRIFLKFPEDPDTKDLIQVPTLMDLYEDGFFVHAFSTFKTVNLFFEIPSEYSRIKKERLLISLIVGKKDRVNLELTHELLDTFVQELKKIGETFKAFYLDSKIREGDPSKFQALKELFFNFYKSYPEREIIYEQKEAKILIFGLSLAGKTTIIRCRRKSISKTIFPTMSIDISRILVNNISLLTYDTPGQSKYKELWQPYLKGQDGLIFVLDVSDKIKYPDARLLLHEIANKTELIDKPLLILFNKIDLEKPDIEYLVQSMGLHLFKERQVKYFQTSGIKNTNIDEAFNWLSLRISESTISTKKSDLGVIFSRWDENLGVKIIAVHPKDAFDDYELIAIRCFSISQFIFGGEEFKRTSVILPFLHLNAMAAVYFDYVYDDSIRGGVLPLSIIIFYNELIPRLVLDQFNTYIFNQFSVIKEKFSDKEFVLEKLKEINSTLNSQIESFEPTLQALKIAELRYESLFKAARDAILIIDLKSAIIVDANKQAETLFQLPFEDFIGLHSSQLLTDQISQDFKDVIFNQIELEEKPLIDVNIISTSGDIIPVEINVNTVQMGSQNLIQCIIRDVTERFNAQKMLEESESKYKQLFEDSPFPIILIDPIGTVVDCNPAFEKSLEYQKRELIGKRFVDLSIVHPDYLVSLLQRFRDEELGINLPSMDLKLFKKDDKVIWANIQSSLVNIGEAIYYQIIGNDITEKKVAEQKLKKILEDLQESEEKLHQEYDRANFYKELFAQDMNEILNNMITSINDYSKLVPAAKLHNTERILGELKRQCESGENLIKIVRGLTQLEELKGFKKKINLCEIIKAAKKEVVNNFPEKTILISVDAPSSELFINANDFLIEVFNNLLTTSIKHNKNQTIKLKIIIFRNIREETNFFKIEFVDYKDDITDVKKSTFLQREESSDSKYRGILLGLTLVERILDSIEGQIWVEGDNFVILIPEFLDI
jgi:PAS domain S-box-containing protein/small GTP-binding protein